MLSVQIKKGGGVGHTHLISTCVRRRDCQRCGAPVLAAIAEGAPVAVDPAPVDPIAELAGIFAGRASYDLIVLAGRHELMWRSFSRMKTRHHPVHLGHPCRHPVTVDDPADSWKKKTTTETRTGRAFGAHIPPPF